MSPRPDSARSTPRLLSRRAAAVAPPLVDDVGAAAGTTFARTPSVTPLGELERREVCSKHRLVLYVRAGAEPAGCLACVRDERGPSAAEVRAARQVWKR
jgi:hypothetical protein